MKNREVLNMFGNIQMNWIKKLQWVKMAVFVAKLQKIIKDEFSILEKAIEQSSQIKDYNKKVREVTALKDTKAIKDKKLKELSDEYKKFLDEDKKKQENYNKFLDTEDFKPLIALPTIKESDLPTDITGEQLTSIINFVK